MDPEYERSLVERARTDPAAFGELFEAYYARILNYAVRRTGSVAAAEDITAETFMKALDKLWQFTWRNVPFSAWLYRIATNEINAWHRMRPRMAYLDDDASIPDDHDLLEERMEAEDALARMAEFNQISEALRALPVRYQEVIALRFFEEKKIAEIATILGKREGTVKSLLSRGLARLRRDLEEPQRSGIAAIMTDEGPQDRLTPRPLQP